METTPSIKLYIHELEVIVDEFLQYFACGTSLISVDNNQAAY